MPITHQQYAEMVCKLDNSTRSRNHPSVTEGVEREVDLHDKIVDYCRQQGWICFHSRMDRKQHANLGMPDFVVATNDGRTIYAEAKRRGGKCTPAQNATLHWLRANKQIAGVVTSLEEFKHLAGV